MKLRNIFFDFDGVIAESANLKTEAFREMYMPYGEEIANEVAVYNVTYGGVSRYKKFVHWEKKYFGKDITETELQQLAKRFSDLVLKKVIESNEVPGSTDFIKKYSEKLNFWIITGTPTKEIEIITNERGISDYFIGVHGSPETKKYWTEYLISTHNLNREETLFLGDATTDQEAAIYSKIHFALRDNEENKDLFKDYKGLRFENFLELESALKNAL